MDQISTNDKIYLFNTLFRGRVDVFALHWEKGNKSGYMPAYQFDPYMYRLHKMKGGTFKDYQDKTYLPLSDHQLLKHFNGEQLVGIYPLLHDNTSWFIAADFDKQNWMEECLKFITVCDNWGIPAYLERSRSGKGGHVWIFFEQPIHASSSRKAMIALLEQAGVFSIFDKSSSFDRLFPNQDYLSGKGLGNLIALPLHKTSLSKGNSCFVDKQMNPYQDQWEFLKTIQRANIKLIESVCKSQTSHTLTSKIPGELNSERLKIVLGKSIHLNRSALRPELVNFLKDELNFANSEYFVKKKSGRNTWGVERYFRLIEETEDGVTIPRGFIGRLIRFCKQQNIDYDFLDERKLKDPVVFVSDFRLRSHQQLSIEVASRKDFGVISSPPGSGKTIIGLKIIAEKQQPALIIVHRKQLLEQWIERIQAFLGIPGNEIGRIGQGKVKIGKAITLAMIQSLGKYLEKQEKDDFVLSFGTIIIDECHHIPAESYRNTISRLSCFYLYGLTATPFRKGNDGKLIFIHLGEIIAEIKPHDIEEFKQARVIVRDTSLDVPFNHKTDPFEILSRILVHDTARNKLILSDIEHELSKGLKVVVITERKEHIEVLYQHLKQSYEVVKLSGEDSGNSRKSKWKVLSSGSYQVLITTGQYFGEGTDLQNVSCLFLVYPFSFKGKLIQYIGRVQRSEVTPLIYDYRDQKIEYLDKLFLKRNRYYRILKRQATLFDDAGIVEKDSANLRIIEKSIRIPINQLDFRYGAIAFKYQYDEINSELEFEVENDHARPEFDVLKPYFSKVLKAGQVKIDIFAEFESNILVSQNADSPDLERINREIIDSVKFRFIERGILGKQYVSGTEDTLMDLNKLQEGQSKAPFYDSEEELLNDILKNRQVKHYRQLRHLASRHKSDILKLRFVLNPFSFVFLLSGDKHFHIIMETLDTEEATYIWHTQLSISQVNKYLLSKRLQEINEDLNIIRNKGRQAFLENQPEDFSRLIHDYSDDRKGFVIWKDQLEERLY